MSRFLAFVLALAVHFGANAEAQDAPRAEIGGGPDAFSDSAAPVNAGAYYLTSPFASVNFQTEAEKLTVVLNSTIFANFPEFATAGVYVDGVYNQTIRPTAVGESSHVVTLPAGNKLVSVINGLQSRPNPAAAPIGTFVVSVSADRPISQVMTVPRNRTLAYGDSISVGGNSSNPDRDGWVPLLRAAAYPNSVALEGWGYRSLHEDANTAALRKSFVNKMVGYHPERIWLAIGTNDYGLNKWDAASFGAAYAAVLDEIHAILPNARIYCQTPLLRRNEAANASGSTLANYRSQIAAAVSSRTAFSTLIDGTSILTLADMADGLHPSTAGHAKYADFVKATLGY